MEANVGWGDTKFALVGLPVAAVRESLDRVTTAMTNSAFKFPMGKTTINLAPADVRQEGPSFDLPIALRARRDGKAGVLVPSENAAEAAVVQGLQVIPIRNLRETAGFLEGEMRIAPPKVDLEKSFECARDELVDMADVKGQEPVKRALEIAAAGGHNLLLLSILSPRIGFLNWRCHWCHSQKLSMRAIFSQALTFPASTNCFPATHSEAQPDGDR